MNGTRVMLPWPASILSPNNRSHWGKKAEAKKTQREAAFILAYNLHMELDPECKYEVILTFCPPNQRVRDLDNMLASMKSALDGMCRAFRIDDRQIKPVPEWGPVVKGGKVEVVIMEKVLDKSP